MKNAGIAGVGRPPQTREAFGCVTGRRGDLCGPHTYT